MDFDDLEVIVRLEELTDGPGPDVCVGGPELRLREVSPPPQAEDLKLETSQMFGDKKDNAVKVVLTA